MKPLLVLPVLVTMSILAAVVFHIGWLAAFIPAAKSGVVVLKILGWTLAPVVTALGYANWQLNASTSALSFDERLTEA